MYDDTHDDEDEDKDKIRDEKWQTMSMKELVEKVGQGIYLPLKEIVSLQSQECFPYTKAILIIQSMGILGEGMLGKGG